MSVQQWINDVKPTSVGNDWDGVTMGDSHTDQVTTTVENNIDS
jgi:hypothetical protein